MTTVKKIILSVTECDIDSIQPYAGNPRKSAAAIKPVINSIKKFGFRQPVVVDKDGVIIAGHVRYQAAQTLKMKRIPVHVATDLDPNQVKAFRIADNRAGEYSKWDFEKLHGEVSAISDSGFNLDELDMDIRNLLDEVPELEIDDVPKFVPVESSTQPRLDRKKATVCPECGHEFTA